MWSASYLVRGIIAGIWFADGLAWAAPSKGRGLIASAALAIAAPCAVRAEALLVVEADTGKVLQADNATYPWYPASVTKMMTAYVTLKAIKDGRMTLDQSLTVSPIKNRAAEIIGASKIVRDITDRKRAEEALGRQTDELARSNLELQRFAHVASHDRTDRARYAAVFCATWDQWIAMGRAQNAAPRRGE